MSRVAPIQDTRNVKATIDLLRRWLMPTLSIAESSWFDAEIERQRGAVDERRLAIAIGLVGRRIGRAELALPADELVAARALHNGWHPEGWASDEMARVALLLATWTDDRDAFAARIERLCITAELSEHVACLKGFAVFPAPEQLLSRAREAVRSSVQPLFEAMASQNAYPADYFDEAGFNQMVVKSVFSGLPISTVVGLDKRRNDDLIVMLRALVSERSAAGRDVPHDVLIWISR